MPNLCDFYDIFFDMYYKSSNGEVGSHDEHEPAHIHIEYKGNKCEVEIETLKFTIYKGSKIRKKVKKIIRRYIEKHKDKLLYMWKTGNIGPLEY